MNEIITNEYKNVMIVPYFNIRTNFYRSYFLGTGEIIDEDYLPKEFLYYRPLFSYIVAARTILKCREKNYYGNIFTTYEAAKWLYEKKCASRMLDYDSDLKKMVLSLSAEVNKDPLRQIRMWNASKWGEININVNKNIEIKTEDILIYPPPEPIKQKKKKKGGDDWFLPVGW